LLRPSLIKTKHLNELRGAGLGYDGELVRLDRTSEGLTASGLCTRSEAPVPDAVILAYDAGNKDPIAFAMTHPVKRPWSITQGAATNGEWTVRFVPEQLPQSPVTISAWAFNATTGQVFRLRGDKQIPTGP